MEILMKRELPAEVMRLQQLIESARRRWIAARASGNVKRATRATCLQTAAERRLSTIKERAMQIRGATDNDLAEIRRIQEELVFAETGYRVGELEQNIVGLLSSGKNSGHQFVVFDDITQRIAGFVEFDPARAMIRAIGVSPGYQGRGIGRRLVRECLMQARAAKRERIGTTCTQPVSEFFEPLGFELETQSKITGPDGRHIDIFAMSRPVEDPFIQERIAALEASVQFFGAGEDKKQARELYVVKGFLRGLGMEFNDDEIVIPLQDPPDALFRDACFEVKELFQQGRLRGPEYKAALAKTRQAFWRDELFEHFTPRDIALADVAAEVTQLAGKYLGRSGTTSGPHCTESSGVALSFVFPRERRELRARRQRKCA
jgi:N-acetylglutamate synthase-like GNAT family acetyltransferase